MCGWVHIWAGQHNSVCTDVAPATCGCFATEDALPGNLMHMCAMQRVRSMVFMDCFNSPVSMNYCSALLGTLQYLRQHSTMVHAKAPRATAPFMFCWNQLCLWTTQLQIVLKWSWPSYALLLTLLHCGGRVSDRGQHVG